ncbi:hypothetical protein [Aquimarina agarivorans]|uniref:hypothetical protein n=1 Tax=Aquimarina agarivorans TaxID=980584 RepID=UPI000248E962|nr:hypothetical protein [Aquimarina agarivorans]
MGQNNIIRSIVKLSKMLVLINESYAKVNHKSQQMVDIEKFEKSQDEINFLRNELAKRFPWYCGLDLFKEENQIQREFTDVINDNVLIKHYNLLLLICSQLDFIKNNLTASTEFKSIFMRLDTLCRLQLNLLKKGVVSKSIRKLKVPHNMVVA